MTEAHAMTDRDDPEGQPAAAAGTDVTGARPGGTPAVVTVPRHVVATDLPPGRDIDEALREWAVLDEHGDPVDDGNELFRFLSAAPDHAADVMRVHFDRWLHSPLGPRLTELVRLAVANQTRCPICLAVRRPGARREGVDEDLVAAVAKGTPSAFTRRERLAIEYAGALAGDHGDVTPQMYAELRTEFDDAEVAELALLAASFLGQGRILETLTRGSSCRVQH